jgi:hypothetical protein
MEITIRKQDSRGGIPLYQMSNLQCFFLPHIRNISYNDDSTLEIPIITGTTFFIHHLPRGMIL